MFMRIQFYLITKDKTCFIVEGNHYITLIKEQKPDIPTAISFLGRRVKKANEEDWDKFCRVIKYVRRTTNVGIRLKIGGVSNKLRVTAFVDASFACRIQNVAYRMLYIYR